MTESKIIALYGHEGSGKSTSARFIASALASRGHTVQIISFATPIKELCKTYMDLDKSTDGAAWRNAIELFSMDMRRMFGNNIFIDYTLKVMQHSLYEFYIIDDLRYISELDALHASEFLTYVLKTRGIADARDTDDVRVKELSAYMVVNKIDTIELPVAYDEIYGFVEKFVDLVI